MVRPAANRSTAIMHPLQEPPVEIYPAREACSKATRSTAAKAQKLSSALSALNTVTNFSISIVLEVVMNAA